MKKSYVTPDMEVKKFSLVGSILFNESEEDPFGGGFPGGGLPENDSQSESNYSIKSQFKINGSGFGW